MCRTITETGCDCECKGFIAHWFQLYPVLNTAIGCKTLQCYSGRLAASSASTLSIQKECPAFLQYVDTTVGQDHFDAGIEILYANSLNDRESSTKKWLTRWLNLQLKKCYCIIYLY